MDVQILRRPMLPLPPEQSTIQSSDSSGHRETAQDTHRSGRNSVNK